MYKIIPVILSGGSGSRLWPLSREKTPKQFLKLMDNFTLLQRTVQRTRDMLPDKDPHIVIITLNNMYDETLRQLNQISPSLAHHILLEPEARNTAAAVALATHYIEKTFGEDSFAWILPADHHIGDEAALKQAMLDAAEAAAQNYLVTFGISPTRPETGYGYICKGETVPGTRSYSVQKFIEKPDYDTASKLVETGQYLWSSGMHMFRVSNARDNFIKYAPESWNLVSMAVSKPYTHKQPLRDLYAQVNKEPFETAVIEKTENLVVIPCDPGWSDIGCWESLWEIKNKDEYGNTVTGNVFYEDTRNSMVLAENRLVTCVGVKDIIVIETDDSILVADKKCNGSLKTLVQKMQKDKREETISSAVVSHDWGTEKILVDTAGTKITDMCVKPDYAITGEIKTFASQMIIVSGQGQLIIDGQSRSFLFNETVSLNQDSMFSIYNSGKEPLKFFMIQFKKPLGIEEGFTKRWPEQDSSSHMAA